MSTDSIRAEAANAAVELNDAMAGASEQIIEVNATIGTWFLLIPFRVDRYQATFVKL